MHLNANKFKTENWIADSLIEEKKNHQMTNTCSEVFFENIPRIPHNKPLAFEMESKTTVLMTFDFSTQTFH